MLSMHLTGGQFFHIVPSIQFTLCNNKLSYQQNSQVLRNTFKSVPSLRMEADCSALDLCSGVSSWFSQFLVCLWTLVLKGDGFLLSTEVFKLDFDENTVSFQLAGGRKNNLCLSVFYNLSWATGLLMQWWLLGHFHSEGRLKNDVSWWSLRLCRGPHRDDFTSLRTYLYFLQTVLSLWMNQLCCPPTVAEGRRYLLVLQVNIVLLHICSGNIIQ